MLGGDGSFTAASGKNDVENEIELSKMHEIDPQSDVPRENDPLTGALRHLAASSRHGAPAELGAGLATAFRRHHARRRLARRMSVAILAACIALLASLLSIRSPHKRPGRDQAH